MNITISEAAQKARDSWDSIADHFNEWGRLGGDEQIELINNELFNAGSLLRVTTEDLINGKWEQY